MNYPVYLALTGAFLSAIGAYWSSRNQANESEQNAKLYKQLADKSNEIAEYAKKQERTSEENAKLYRQLAEQSDEITGYAKKQERASEDVIKIQQKLGEKADIQIQKTEEIARLNADLAESQKEIARLSKDITNNVTGGDSFCYMNLSYTTDDKIKKLFELMLNSS